MGRVSLKFEYEELQFPLQCPNCLSSPAISPVMASRDSGAMAVSMGWPHCRQCAADEGWRQRRLGFLKWGLIGSLCLTVLSVLIYFQGGLLPDAVCIVGAAAGVLFVLALLVLILRSIANKPKPTNAVTLGSGVRVIRGGTSLTGKQFLSLVFTNEKYAEMFRELNRL